MRLLLIGGFQGWLLGGCSSFLCGFGGSLGLTLAATHFTRVVRRTAVGQDNSGRFHRRRGFDRCRFDGHWCRLGHHFWLGFDNRGRLLGNRSGFGHGWGLLDFTGLDGRCFYRCFGNHYRFGSRCLLDHWLRSDFDHWLGSCLDHGHRLADRQLDHGGHGHFFSFGCSFDLLDLLDRLGDFAVVGFRYGGDLGSGKLGLLVGLCFSVGTDVAAGDSGSHGQAGGQFGTQLGGLMRLRLLFAAFFLAAIDQLAVGVALTLTTVAATTLATGTAAWALAIVAFLFVLQQLFVRQLLFG